MLHLVDLCLCFEIIVVGWFAARLYIWILVAFSCSFPALFLRFCELKHQKSFNLFKHDEIYT